MPTPTTAVPLPCTAPDLGLGTTSPAVRAGVSRRTLLAAAPAVALGATLLRPRAAQAAELAPLHAAAPADALADMFGVVGVTSTRSGIYGDHATVQARLAELKVRYVRNCLFDGNKGQIQFIQQLRSQTGIKMDLLLGDPTMAGGTPERLVSLAATNLQGCIASFEGANEWNLHGGTGWVSELRTHQRRIWAAAKADSRTAGIPVLGPSLGMRKDFDVLGNLSDALDVGSMHLYQGGYAPGYRADEQLTAIRQVVGSKKVHVTETGWHNAVKSTSTHHYTPEDVAATYAPRVYLDYFQRGVPRVYLFQLCDDQVDPGLTDHEAHFGLVRSDYSRKPVFDAMKNFMALVDDRGPAFAPGSVRYAVEGAPADLRQQLVQRRDGSFVLFLWRDVAIFDPVAGVRQVVAPAPVQLRFARQKGLRVFQPTAGAAALTTTTASLLSLSLGAEVLAVEVRRPV